MEEKGILQSMDGCTFRLRAPFDFGFLRRWGNVFCVFDDQDSGNICFGCENGGERVFLKFAGAPTLRGTDRPEDAVARLRAAEPVYAALHHRCLPEYLGSEAVGGGFLLVFRWADGVCMGKMYPEAHRAFTALPLEEKQRVFGDVLSFFQYLAAQRWLAVDFYDGSILYDFAAKRTTICDIDFFRRSPSVNDMGRMWGSARFQSPEEYVRGAVLDEVTNVYTLGATAFSVFGEDDRSRAAWPLSERAFRVAEKAVSSDRAARYLSIQAFAQSWADAVRQT